MISAESRNEKIFALGLVLLGVAARVLPHPQNFAPVASLAFFAGVVLPPSLALTVPLLTMMASDLVIGPHGLEAFTWGSFLIIGVLGTLLRGRKGPWALVGGTLAGSVLFFFVSNFGVFLYGGLYPRTLDGLVRCYVLAVPFFRNTLLGDVFFSAVLFGTFAAAKRSASKALASRAS